MQKLKVNFKFNTAKTPKTLKRQRILGVLAEFCVFAVLSLAACALWAHPAEAHMRDYLLNQEYYTAERGEFEVETFNDLKLREADNSDTYASKHQVELEYGLLDHLQLAGYAVWEWGKGEPVAWDEWKAEAKYRFLEAGALPVDVAVYLEYANTNGSPPDDSDELEGKLILSKTWSAWNVTANWIMEKEIQNANNWEHSWTAGVTYAWTPRFKTGLEWKETLGTSEDFGFRHVGYQVQLMPTIGWSPTPHSKILVGPAFGLSRAAPDVEIRTMVAVEF